MYKYHIPFHIQEEIMKRLPVKSLIRFRSVSKAWKSLIDSSEFVVAHNLQRHTQPQHMLATKMEKDVLTFTSYIGDDTFPQQRTILYAPQQLICPNVVGSSRGLVCLYGIAPNWNTDMALLWNPSIRKSIVIAIPHSAHGLGFGVCPVTNDPKMVLITQSIWYEPETSYRSEVMVYTLSSGKWTSVSNNLPPKAFQYLYSMVVTGRFIYWLAIFETRYMIMSFDMTNEIFEVIELPDRFATRDLGYSYISKLRESLAILESGGNITTIWMMEDGIQRSFTKLFTINTTYQIMGFSKSGVPIMKVEDDDDRRHKLVVYEPNSEYKNVLEIDESNHSFYLNSYSETLFLLSRSDCISY